MKTIKIIVFAEHTIQAGQLVPANLIDERGEDSDDFRVFAGSKTALLKEARELAKTGRRYDSQVAESIKTAVI